VAIEPPILQKIQRLRAEIERAVPSFPSRTHRYGIGEQLRAEILEVGRYANRAWRDPARIKLWTEKLVWAVDEFKQSLQVGHELKAFASFGQFQALIVLAEELGKQCGGWKRQHRTDHPIGQNGPGRRAQGQRAQTLSTSGASLRGQP
jgi:hypothetical protein